MAKPVLMLFFSLSAASIDSRNLRVDPEQQEPLIVSAWARHSAGRILAEGGKGGVWSYLSRCILLKQLLHSRQLLGRSKVSACVCPASAMRQAGQDEL